MHGSMHKSAITETILPRNEQINMPMEFEYTVTTKKEFGAAVASVEDEIVKAGFTVLYIHDVQATLAGKGFAIEPMKIIEFCNAKFAHAALTASPQIGLLLPCKILVYAKDDATTISAMRPAILSAFFPDAPLGELPIKIDRLVQSIVDRSA